jgi:HTH-type transcriptional regulator / antitoxin MqsA
MERVGPLSGAMMSERWKGSKCPTCFEGTLHQQTKRTQFEYRNHILEYDQEGAWCNSCGEGIVTGNEVSVSDSVLDDFVARVDQEEALELSRIRRKLGLSQKEAARIAGGGHNAFSRYERGQAKPLAAVIHLFRLLDRHPELLSELKQPTAV